MRVIPALDLREGACVQLVGGDYAAERVRESDPLAVARRWAAAGFRELHVVDLDAATGRGGNAAVIEALLAPRAADVQVGGGVRDEAAVARWLGAGAARVVVGTRAVEDPAWLDAVSARHPGRVVVALDVRGRDVLVRGWAERTPLDVVRTARALAPLPLAGLLVTAVDREGRLGGTDLELHAALREVVRVPLIASGGITTMDDLRTLERLGVDAAVLGMSLYTGALDAAAAAEFSS